MIAWLIRWTGDLKHCGTLYDPTCGEGLFLQALAAEFQNRAPGPRDDYHWRWKTYGVELDESRAQEAASRLDTVVCAALEQTVVEGTADLVFLNPPYDVVGGERIEGRFLRLALPNLRIGGVAIFVLPECYVGTGSEVKAFVGILRRFAITNIRVFRFPDPEYAPFKQYVILGTRTTESDWSVQHGNYDLTPQGVLGDVMLTASQQAEFLGQRPAGLSTLRVTLPKELVQAWTGDKEIHNKRLTLTRTEIGERPANFTEADLRRLYPLLGEPVDRPTTFRPLMPISDLHAAAVVAAGYLDGVVVAGKILRGSTFKRTIKRDGFVDGVKTEINAEISVTQLSILDEATGDLRIINSEDHPDEFDEFIISNVRVLVDTIKEHYPPIFTEAEFQKWEPALAQVKAPRTLKGHSNGMFVPQRRMSAAILTYWQKVGKVGLINGEMSSGKTVQSLAAASLYALARFSRKIIIILPAKDDLALKWKEEALTALRFFNPRVTFIGDAWKKRTSKREATPPLQELQQLMDSDRFEVILMKETTAKLSSGWKPVHGWRKAHGWAFKSGYAAKNFADNWARNNGHAPDRVRLHKGEWNVLCSALIRSCTACGADLDKIEDWEWNSNQKQYCPKCAAPLWTSVPRESERTGYGIDAPYWAELLQLMLDKNPDGPAGKWLPDGRGGFTWTRLIKLQRGEWLTAMADLRIRGRRGGGSYPLARYLREHYHDQFTLVIDEAHKMKGGDTAIGYASADLLVGCRKGLIMTGTVFNGAASSIFYLLYRSQPWFRQMFEYNDVQRFVDHYGLMQTITKWYPESKTDSASGYREIVGNPSERPGVAPGMVIHLLRCGAFIKLADLGFPMPSYKESTLFVDPDPELIQVYEPFIENCRSNAAAAAKDHDYSPRGEYQMARWGILDVPRSNDQVANVSWTIPELPTRGFFTKEEALLRIVAREKAAGRKVLCFVSQIKRRNPCPTLIELLKRFGMVGKALYAEESGRKQFIEYELSQGADVIFCSPGIVDVGIDLDMFATAVWYGLEYNALTVAQANRRLWRLTQLLGVEIIFLAYNQTPQAIGFDRVATRLAAMQALQGDLRAGLALLRGERDFLADLQEAVDDSWRGKRFESTYKLSDFPELHIFQKPVLPPVEELLWTPNETAYGQFGFNW